MNEFQVSCLQLFNSLTTHLSLTALSSKDGNMNEKLSFVRSHVARRTIEIDTFYLILISKVKQLVKKKKLRFFQSTYTSREFPPIFSFTFYRPGISKKCSVSGSFKDVYQLPFSVSSCRPNLFLFLSISLLLDLI